MATSSEAGRTSGHGHGHGDASVGRWAFLVGIGLNVAFVGVEAVAGVVSHSTALWADAAHNLSDVLGLVVAWGASGLARLRPSPRHTYGLRRSTVLAALANAVLLLAAVGGVVREAIHRFDEPAPVQGATMMAVAAIGVVINAASAALFYRRGGHDANVRAAFLHLAADAAVSLGVVVAGGIVLVTGSTLVDPLTSLLVSVVVLFGTWGLLRDALHLSLDGVPFHIELEEVRAFLVCLPDVKDVHDLHVWAMSTTEVALTAHLVMAWPEAEPPFLASLERELEERFGIAHATIQIESCIDGDCRRMRPGAV